MRTHTLSILAAQLFVALGPAAAMSAAPPANQITIKDFMFAPASLTIRAGTTVTWLNEDEEPHTVVSASGLFRSKAIDTQESFTFTFDKPGEYHFICTIHPQMSGTVIVQ
jgi:plastocyanin